MHRTVNRLLFATSLYLVSMVVGTVGFMSLEGYSLVDGIYMSVITFSTVGFTEVVPLSNSGKIFSVVYISINLGIFAYTVSVISSILFEGELNKVFKSYFVNREVKKLKNHVIVCGLGSNGERACEELNDAGQPFVIIEDDSGVLDDFPDDKKYNFILGDATTDETLIEAGLERAGTIITTLPSDAENVFITLTAKEINSNIQVIARASEPSAEKKLLRAGASYVVMPDRLGGMHMANLVTKPYVIELLEMLNGVGKQPLELEEVDYEHLKDEIKDKSLSDLDIRNKTGATIIAYKDDKEGFLFNPHSDKKIGAGDVLIVLGTKENLTKFNDEFKIGD